VWLADITIDPTNNNATVWTLHYYHNDHLGTPQRLTDKDGNVTWKANYESFGRAIIDSSSAVSNPLRLPGQFYDPETGTHYNWNRDYDNDTGRYQQADPIGLKGGINTYAYVFNRPTKYFDERGLKANLCCTPRSEQSCCQEFESNGGFIDSNGIAAEARPVCCAGKKIVCISQTLPDHTPLAKIRRACIRKHEQTHFADTGPCLNCEVGQNPPKPDIKDLRPGECKATKAAVQCFKNKVSECGTDMNCIKVIGILKQEEIDYGNDDGNYKCF